MPTAGDLDKVPDPLSEDTDGGFDRDDSTDEKRRNLKLEATSAEHMLCHWPKTSIAAVVFVQSSRVSKPGEPVTLTALRILLEIW